GPARRRPPPDRPAPARAGGGPRHRRPSHRRGRAPDGAAPAAAGEPRHRLQEPATPRRSGTGQGAARAPRALRRQPQRAPPLHLPGLRPDRRRGRAAHRAPLARPGEPGGFVGRVQRRAPSHRVLRALRRLPQEGPRAGRATSAAVAPGPRTTASLTPQNVARRIRGGRKEPEGSKSHDNLKEAFAGAWQANRRYLYFARVADIEGSPVAGLFKDTARWRTRRPPSPWTAGRRPRDSACR